MSEDCTIYRGPRPAGDAWGPGLFALSPLGVGRVLGDPPATPRRSHFAGLPAPAVCSDLHIVWITFWTTSAENLIKQWSALLVRNLGKVMFRM